MEIMPRRSGLLGNSRLRAGQQLDRGSKLMLIEVGIAEAERIQRGRLKRKADAGRNHQAQFLRPRKTIARRRIRRQAEARARPPTGTSKTTLAPKCLKLDPEKVTSLLIANLTYYSATMRH
jgi:hypothetical protein